MAGEHGFPAMTRGRRRHVQLRFGLEDGRARTLEEVGKEFNVTRERIRQIDAKAPRKLRHASRPRKLTDDLEEGGRRAEGTSYRRTTSFPGGSRRSGAIHDKVRVSAPGG